MRSNDADVSHALDHSDPDNQRLRPLPAEDLEAQVQSVLDHAVDAQRKDLKVYESLRNLNEVVDTEYGDRSPV